MKPREHVAVVANTGAGKSIAYWSFLAALPERANCLDLWSMPSEEVRSTLSRMVADR